MAAESASNHVTLARVPTRRRFLDCTKDMVDIIYIVIFAMMLRKIARVKRKRREKELELSKEYGNQRAFPNGLSACLVAISRKVLIGA